ncbi:MAG: PPOX class F420-dependent oxidoreductase [Gemmatimonadota bacterium]
MEATAADGQAGRAAGDTAGAALVPGRYLSLTSYRRDGTGVATPVWFVQDKGLILVQTDAESGKARRIRRDPSVTIAPCTATGRLRGTPARATARQLPAGAMSGAEPLFRRKYRFDLLVLRPVRAVQAALGRGRQPGTPVIIEITPG